MIPSFLVRRLLENITLPLSVSFLPPWMVGAGRMTQQSRAFAGFVEDQLCSSKPPVVPGALSPPYMQVKHTQQTKRFKDVSDPSESAFQERSLKCVRIAE